MLQDFDSEPTLQTFKLADVDGTVIVALPNHAVDALFCSLTEVAKSVFDLQESSFILAARKITQAHLFATLSQIPEIQSLGSVLFEESTPDDALLTYDIKALLNGAPIVIRVALSKTFCLSWKRGVEELGKIEALSCAEIPLIIEGGKIQTTLLNVTNISLGDFIQIDFPYFSLNSDKMKGMILLDERPLFRVRIKEGIIKIVETPLQYQELIAMPTRSDDLDYHTNDEESLDIDLNPFEEEDSDEDELIDEEHASSTPSVKQKSHQKESLEAAAEGTTQNTQSETGKTEFARLEPKDIPISMSVELARINMSADQLLTLSPGSVLDIEIKPEHGVFLSIHGRIIAKGELMQVGDVLGVRILELGN